jgi:WD40 repeat protein
MARAAILLLLIAASAAADPPVRLGSDRLRQAGPVEAIAYSADGKILATADAKAVHLWDPADGHRRHTLSLPDRTVSALWVGNDGTVLAAAVDGQKATRFLRLDPAAAKVVADLPVHDNPCFGPFSPDGRWLTVRDREDFQVIDTATGRRAWGTTARDQLFCFAVRPDGKAVATGRRGTGIAVYDLATGKVLHDFSVDRATVWDLAFSPNGKDLVAEVAVPGPNGVARFDPATGAERWRFVTGGRARGLAFTPDGREVRYWGNGGSREDPEVWRWLDAATGKPVHRTLDTGTVCDTTVSQDGKLLAICDYHGHISQWDLTTCKRLDASADPPEPVTELRFSPDGKTVCGLARGRYEWDVATGKQTRLGPAVPPGESRSATASADRRWFARIVGAEPRPRTVEVTDLRTGASSGIEAGKDKYREVRFLADGRLMARTVDALMTFDPETGKRLVSVPMGRDFDGTASDDGTTAVVIPNPVDDRIQVTIWDFRAGLRTGEWIGRILDEPTGRASDPRPALSPDCRVLAYFFTTTDGPESDYHTVLFDRRTGRRLGRWTNRNRPAGLAFAADGRSMATYSDKASVVHVHEVATGARRREIQADSATITGAAFSPDGRRLAIATTPGPVELRDLMTDPWGDAKTWDAKKADRAWDRLGGQVGEETLAAIVLLRTLPAEAVTFLKTRIKVRTTPTADWIAARITDLDAPAYRDREKASAELAEVGELVGPALAAARATATAEARERLTALLATVEALTPDKLRAIRACEVLEGMGTPEARELLAIWAKGPAGATLTREAAESLERLGRR